VFAFNTAVQFVRTGAARVVLVVGTEKLSSIVDYQDRNTCVIFGDGAGAMVLTPLDRAGRGEFLSSSIRTEGGKDDILMVPAGGSRLPASAETLAKRLHYMVMGGNKVYRFAVSTFAALVEESLAPYGREQLGRIVPHQVNQRIVEAAAERLDMPMDLMFSNIHRYGNTAAASVPMAFDEAYREDKLPKGKLVVCAAFGAGLSWGHFLVRW
jgi:3-oxoacyl-[acyl-carrier-protein] synthase-3